MRSPMRLGACAVLILALCAADASAHAQPAQFPRIPIGPVAFSPDGRSAVVARGCGISLWDLTTGRCVIRELGFHYGQVVGVAFLPDGKQVISAETSQSLPMSGDARPCLAIWDVTTGKEVRAFARATRSLRAMALSPSGKVAFTADADGLLQTWDLASGKVLCTFADKVGAAYAAWSPDGASVATAGGQELFLWDAATGKRLQTMDGYASWTHAVAFSATGHQLAAGNFDNVVRLRDVATGSVARTFQGPAGSAGCVAFTPDGEYLISGGSTTPKSELRIWDLSTGKLVRAVDWPYGGVSDLTVSPDGKRVLVNATFVLTLWDLERGEEIRTLIGENSYGPAFTAVSFAADGKRAFALGGGAITVWDPATGKELRTLHCQERLFSSLLGAFPKDGPDLRILRDSEEPFNPLAVGPVGRLALANAWTGRGDGTPALLLWDLSTGQKVRAVEGQKGYILCATFSRDGRLVLTDDNSDIPANCIPGGCLNEDNADPKGNALKLRDVATGRLIRTFDGQKDRVFRAAFTADGKRVLALGHQLKLWDVATGKVVREFPEYDLHRGRIGNFAPGSEHGSAAAVSPDGRLGVTGDKKLQLWDLENGSLLRTLGETVGNERYADVAFSPDGRLLVAIDPESDIQLWNPETGLMVRSLVRKGLPSHVWSAAFSSDGKQLLTGQDKETMILWEVTTGREIRRFVREGEPHR